MSPSRPPEGPVAVLDRLCRRWRRRRLATGSIRAVVASLVASSAALVLGAPPSVAAWAGAAVAILGLAKAALAEVPDRRSAARHLDRTVPAVEESAELLLAEPGSLPLLARLQQRRIEEAMAGLDEEDLLPPVPYVSLAGPLIAVSVLVAAVALLETGFEIGDVGRSVRPGVVETLDPDAAVGPLPGAASVTVIPPDYTGLPRRNAEELDLSVVAGSIVRWRIEGEHGGARLVLPGGTQAFEPRDGALVAERAVTDDVVYALEVDGPGGARTRSPWARIAVVPDRAPRLAFRSPDRRLTPVDGTEALRLEVEIEDDFGVTGTTLVATLARGSGELVEFRERRLSLPRPEDPRGGRVAKTLELGRLGLEAGSEIYLRAEAVDALGQRGRSATAIVRWAGDVRESTGFATGIPVALPPAAFRSQRQIIIDTERLVAEEEAISPAELRRRSEALGLEQRALRMRHGTLLGDEFVSGLPVSAGAAESAPGAGAGEEGHEGHDHGDPPTGSPTDPAPSGGAATDAGIPAELFHSHDSAEANTYFADDVRTTLRAMLAEMWEAEGRLRAADPEGALPSERRALALLEEARQASRVLVPRIGFDPPPVRPDERRLTGDLSDIRSRARRRDGDAGTSPLVASVGFLLRELEGPEPRVDEAEIDLVREVLAGRASRDRDPSAMAALETLDRLVADEALGPDERDRLATTLEDLLSPPELRPVPPNVADDPLVDGFRPSPRLPARPERSGRDPADPPGNGP